jgi:hypothetical protein
MKIQIMRGTGGLPSTGVIIAIRVSGVTNAVTMLQTKQMEENGIISLSVPKAVVLRKKEINWHLKRLICLIQLILKTGNFLHFCPMDNQHQQRIQTHGNMRELRLQFRFIISIALNSFVIEKNELLTFDYSLRTWKRFIQKSLNLR